MLTGSYTKEIIYLVYDVCKYLIVVLVSVIQALDFFDNFHSHWNSFLVGILYGTVLSILMAHIHYCIRKHRYLQINLSLGVLFIILWVFVDLESLQEDEQIRVNPNFHVPTFVLGLVGKQSCRSEYITQHLHQHGIEPKFIEGLDITKKYTPGELSGYLKTTVDIQAPPPLGTNTIMTASMIKSIYDAYWQTTVKDKWLLVLENDAKLHRSFTYRLPPLLIKAEQYDVVFLYKPLSPYNIFGWIPCCMVGMAYHRERIPVILSKYNFHFLHEHGLMDVSNPEPSDLLLATLCNYGHLRCKIIPLVTESVLGKQTTH